MFLTPISIILSTLCIAHAKIYERCELARELRNFHLPEDEIPTWVCIAEHESRYDTSATNYASGDHGLFQISQIYWCSPPGGGFGCNQPCSKFRDDDIADDLQCIRRIHNEHKLISGNGFNAWVVYPLYCKNDNSRYIQGCFDQKLPTYVNTTENEIPDKEVDEYGDGYQFPPLPSISESKDESSGDKYNFPKLPSSSRSINFLIKDNGYNFPNFPSSKTSINDFVTIKDHGYNFSDFPSSKTSINDFVPIKDHGYNFPDFPSSKTSINDFVPIKDHGYNFPDFPSSKTSINDFVPIKDHGYNFPDFPSSKTSINDFVLIKDHGYNFPDFPVNKYSINDFKSAPKSEGQPISSSTKDNEQDIRMPMKPVHSEESTSINDFVPIKDHGYNFPKFPVSKYSINDFIPASESEEQPISSTTKDNKQDTRTPLIPVHSKESINHFVPAATTSEKPLINEGKKADEAQLEYEFPPLPKISDEPEQSQEDLTNEINYDREDKTENVNLIADSKLTTIKPLTSTKSISPSTTLYELVSKSVTPITSNSPIDTLTQRSTTFLPLITTIKQSTTVTSTTAKYNRKLNRSTTPGTPVTKKIKSKTKSPIRLTTIKPLTSTKSISPITTLYEFVSKSVTPITSNSPIDTLSQRSTTFLPLITTIKQSTTVTSTTAKYNPKLNRSTTPGTPVTKKIKSKTKSPIRLTTIKPLTSTKSISPITTLYELVSKSVTPITSNSPIDTLSQRSTTFLPLITTIKQSTTVTSTTAKYNPKLNRSTTPGTPVTKKIKSKTKSPIRLTTIKPLTSTKSISPSTTPYELVSKSVTPIASNSPIDTLSQRSTTFLPLITTIKQSTAVTSTTSKYNPKLNRSTTPGTPVTKKIKSKTKSPIRLTTIKPLTSTKSISPSTTPYELVSKSVTPIASNSPIDTLSQRSTTFLPLITTIKQSTTVTSTTAKYNPKLNRSTTPGTPVTKKIKSKTKSPIRLTTIKPLTSTKSISPSTTPYELVSKSVTPITSNSPIDTLSQSSTTFPPLITTIKQSTTVTSTTAKYNPKLNRSTTSGTPVTKKIKSKTKSPIRHTASSDSSFKFTTKQVFPSSQSFIPTRKVFTTTLKPATTSLKVPVTSKQFKKSSTTQKTLILDTYELQGASSTLIPFTAVFKPLITTFKPFTPTTAATFSKQGNSAQKGTISTTEKSVTTAKPFSTQRRLPTTFAQISSTSTTEKPTFSKQGNSAQIGSISTTEKYVMSTTVTPFSTQERFPVTFSQINNISTTENPTFSKQWNSAQIGSISTTEKSVTTVKPLSTQRRLPTTFAQISSTSTTEEPTFSKQGNSAQISSISTTEKSVMSTTVTPFSTQGRFPVTFSQINNISTTENPTFSKQGNSAQIGSISTTEKSVTAKTVKPFSAQRKLPTTFAQISSISTTEKPTFSKQNNSAQRGRISTTKKAVAQTTVKPFSTQRRFSTTFAQISSISTTKKPSFSKQNNSAQRGRISTTKKSVALTVKPFSTQRRFPSTFAQISSISTTEKPTFSIQENSAQIGDISTTEKLDTLTTVAPPSNQERFPATFAQISSMSTTENPIASTSAKPFSTADKSVRPTTSRPFTAQRGFPRTYAQRNSISTTKKPVTSTTAKSFSTQGRFSTTITQTRGTTSAENLNRTTTSKPFSTQRGFPKLNKINNISTTEPPDTSTTVKLFSIQGRFPAIYAQKSDISTTKEPITLTTANIFPVTYIQINNDLILTTEKSFTGPPQDQTSVAENVNIYPTSTTFKPYFSFTNKPFTTTTFSETFKATSRPLGRQVTFAPDSFFSWIFGSQTLPPLVPPVRPPRPSRPSRPSRPPGPPGRPGGPHRPLGEVLRPEEPNALSVPVPPEYYSEQRPAIGQKEPSLIQLVTTEMPVTETSTRKHFGRPFSHHRRPSTLNTKSLSEQRSQSTSIPSPFTTPIHKAIVQKERTIESKPNITKFKQLSNNLNNSVTIQTHRNSPSVSRKLAFEKNLGKDAVEVKLDDNFVFYRTRYGYRLFRNDKN